MVLGCKKIRSKVLSNSVKKKKGFTKLKTWEETENNFAQELQSRDLMFEYVNVSTFYFISYLFPSLFFFMGFEQHVKLT